MNPSWVVTFVRWKNRFLYPEQVESAPPALDFLQTLPNLVVDDDCASVSTSMSKSAPTPSVQALFYPGKVNFLTAISPGDYMFVNMVNFENDAKDIANRAKNNEPINRVDDGFKGYFKVNSVRRVLSVDPATGSKRVMYSVSGFAMSEFNNTLYFNPFLISQNEANNQFLFVSIITDVIEQYVSKKGVFKIQDIIQILINATIGDGPNPDKITNKVGRITPNTHFYVPKNLGSLLGNPAAKSAADINQYIFGIQEYSANSPTLSRGFAPRIGSVKGRFVETPIPVEGVSLIKPEYWNQVTVWSILNQYLNSPINEMFNSFRMDQNGNVLPTLVLRQMPYSSPSYKEGPSTKYMNLPRWRISPDLLKDIDIGREEAARLNFIQVNAQLAVATPETNSAFLSQQIAGKNFQADILDVQRSGLKPYIFSTNFDSIVTDKVALNASKWAKLMADALIGGELKLNGSIQTQGIVEPITIGDNLELDGVVYHIEALSHSASLLPDGKRNFTTSLQLSHGLDIRTEEMGKKVFPQMENQSIQDELSSDNKNFNSVLPGISSDSSSQYPNASDLTFKFPSTPVGELPAPSKKQTVDDPNKRSRRRSR